MLKVDNRNTRETCFKVVTVPLLLTLVFGDSDLPNEIMQSLKNLNERCEYIKHHFRTPICESMKIFEYTEHYPADIYLFKVRNKTVIQFR